MKKPASASWTMPTMLACSDIFAVLFSSTVCVLIRYAFSGEFELVAYLKLWPVLFFFIISFAITGAYNFLMAAPIEFKRCTLATGFMFLFLAAITFWSRSAATYSRTILFCSCALTILLVPIFRRKCRRLMANCEQWRLPAIIYGSGEVAQSMVKNLNRHLCLGLRPVALIGDSYLCDDTACFGVRKYSSGAIQELAAQYPQAYFIIADPGLSLEQYQDILRESNRFFTKAVIAPDIFRQASMWANVVDINGILGLETGQKLLAPWPKFYKRVIDVTCAGLGMILLSPALLLLCVLIRLDSPGSVFYFQKRIGRGGREFNMWKFRTMVKNADKILTKHLDERPEFKKEWMEKHKLGCDPRITRIGKLLRKTSLDELPQLVNVLKGDMSLVGPRPIIAQEIERYSDTFELYKKVYPGMTGLWQVSGRSGLEYDERVQLDVYYVRNWSIWFDLYILSRTPAAVFRGNGAC